ncbi:MAG: ATP-binding cassette domain-containing protein [Actinomycetota bacterium]|nr:ATP-binding cassette domain-containing protein [Actinomycetota bacterium]
MSKENLLMDVNDLSVTFGAGANTVEAVKNCSMTVHEGEPIGIVGESGSGKSTLARVLAGLQQPSAGKVLYRGENVFTGNKSYKNGFRNQVQMVFQDPYGSLNPQLTGLSAVSEAVRIHKKVGSDEAEAIALELLQQMGISRLDALKKPRQLSGGQRQRVSVARALSASPSVLLADEPTSAIDQSAQAQLLKLFQGLLGEGLAIVLVSHDLGVIRFLTKRVYVMKEGLFIESGDTETVFNDPQEEYTKLLLASIPGELGKAARAKLKKS